MTKSDEAFERYLTTNPQSLVDAWNSAHKPGAAVTYENDFGRLIPGRTRTQAAVLGGHTAVIWLDGRTACVALDRVKPAAAKVA